MIKRPNIGPTLRAFDIYGRGWLSLPPNSVIAALGAARIHMAGQGEQIEHYQLGQEPGYCLLLSRLGAGRDRLLARVSRAQLPEDERGAGLALLAELWSLRDAARVRLLAVAQAGALGEESWQALLCDHGPGQSTAEDPQDRPLDQHLLGQGLCVETVSGAMGTAEHVLLLGRTRVAAA